MKLSPSVGEWRAAVLFCASLLTAYPVSAQESGESSKFQAMIHGGGVGGLGPSGFGPSAMLDLLWRRWPFGGIWWELGVFDAPYDYQHSLGYDSILATGSSSETGSSQYLEASLGVLFSGSESNFIAPYVRPGIGIYQTRVSPQLTFGTTKYTYQWSPGVSFATGARVGSSR